MYDELFFLTPVVVGAIPRSPGNYSLLSFLLGIQRSGGEDDDGYDDYDDDDDDEGTAGRPRVRERNRRRHRGRRP